MLRLVEPRPLATALLAAVAWVKFPQPAWQRYSFIGVLVLLCVWRVASPYLAASPPSRPARVHDGVYLQSNLSACAAAAGASALKNVGMDTDESEMTRLCLTTEDGTTMLGLYRGLAIKCQGSRFKPVAIQGSASDLRSAPLPAVIMIGQPGAGDWLNIGNRHAVVLFGFDNLGRARRPHDRAPIHAVRGA